VLVLLKRALILITLVFAASGTAVASPISGTAQDFTYGSGLTAFPYIVYTPHGWQRSDRMPLLVMLHGCQTTAYEQMEANLYNPLADKQGFVVAYPDTDAIENAQPGPTARCWQFPSPEDWTRGDGDGAAVAAITHAVISGWNIDPQRVYVIGMSAGAFLSADVATEYPDLFAASGENAGSAYADGTCLLQSTVSLPVEASAQMAFQQEGTRARVVPRIVIGGDADQGVPPACADKALQQSLRTNNLVIDGSQTAPIRLTPASVQKSKVPGGYSYTTSNYLDEHGCLIGQRVLVHGMNHFWSGGSSNPKWADFTDPKGPSAAIASWNFFSRFTLSNTARSCRAPHKPAKHHKHKHHKPRKHRHRRKRRHVSR
jgi:poly(hydroxyalkanoate) depolymerase family esterase